MEASVCFSNLKQIYSNILSEANVSKNDLVALAIWEQIKNTEHRPDGTEAKISVKTKSRMTVIETRNPVSPSEIIRHLDRDALEEDDQLELEDHRGETIILQFVGEGNYTRFVDPFTKEMVTRIYLPAKKAS